MTKAAAVSPIHHTSTAMLGWSAAKHNPSEVAKAIAPMPRSHRTRWAAKGARSGQTALQCSSMLKASQAMPSPLAAKAAACNKAGKCVKKSSGFVMVLRFCRCDAAQMLGGQSSDASSCQQAQVHARHGPVGVGENRAQQVIARSQPVQQGGSEG